MRRATKGEKIFYNVNYIVLTLMALATLLPFINVISVAFSNETAIRMQKVTFYPVGFTLAAFKFTFENSQFVNSLKVSLFVTIVGTFLAVLITFITAYPLSKPNLKLRKPMLIFFIIPMVFSGGLIPWFLLIKGLGLYNKIWALIIPFIFSTYNMLLVKNYLETLPSEVEEAAMIDGVSSMQLLFYIVLPMAKPVIATITLFVSVGLWNSYFPGMFLVSDPKLKPIQTYLYELVRMTTLPVNQLPPEIAMRLTPDSISSANIVISTIPILLVYPYLQKYFVKGLVVGSVK